MDIKNLNFSYLSDFEKEDDVKPEKKSLNLSNGMSQDTTDYLISKIAFFIVNIIFMLPFIIKNFSIIGLIASLVVFALLFFAIYRTSKSTPGITVVPYLFAADLLCFIAVYYKQLGENFDVGNISYIVSNFNPWFFIFLIVGLLFLFIGFKNNKFIWLGGIGAFLYGLASVFSVMTTHTFEDLKFYENGAGLIAILFLVVFFITALLYLTDAVSPDERKRSTIISFAVLTLMLILFIFDFKFILELSSGWVAKLLVAPTTIFKWWKVILAVVVLSGYTFVLYILDDKYTPDAFLATFVAIAILAAKIAMSMYFTLNTVLYIVLLAGMIYCAYNSTNEKPTFRCAPPLFFLLSFVVYLVSMILLYNGLWINFIITALFGVIFYFEWPKENSKANSILSIVFVALETAGLMFQYRFALESYYFLVMVFAGVLATYLILTRPHPNQVRCKKIIANSVCVVFLALCLLIFTQGGSRIKIEKNEEAPKVSVSIEARGKENSISESYYYWKDSTGQKVAEDKYFKEDKLDLNIEGEVLTVVTVDKKGIQTSRKYWFPYYIQNVYFAQAK